ncbi:hypothetical protein F6I18_06175 [Corynebacterium amycolatum]|uniref:hypothetical protein n=1 Tax=Corynebacterium TaxID=1716 RepID=UPI0006617A1D|nr:MULTISPECIES: hypothetical protein [Corynebacterium]KAA9268646.1 hypothetical protein F6I18_06175 [Corynebacterium amycolatum]MBU5624302.1 hypothetical protein [Corynebacterium amycolatum]MCQ9171792.1 hypothetical protein [Corynebacterium amycolatum]
MTQRFRTTLTQSARSHSERVAWVFVLSWILMLTTAVCWPLFIPHKAPDEGRFGAPMFLLRDMVIPNHPPLTDAALGLGPAAARAVPQDTALWALGYFVDASHWVRFAMVGACLIGGLAAAELARRLTLDSAGAGASATPGSGLVRMTPSLVSQLIAPTMLLWNPFVVERLLQGQWSLVIAVLLLPAVVLATQMGSALWRTSVIAAAGLTPTGALLAGITGLVAARNNRDRAWIATTTVAVSSPWLIASLLNPSAAGPSDAAGAAAFAARAEAHVGTLGSLLGLGGIWNKQAVPLTREAGFSAIMVLVLLVLMGLGFRRVWDSRERWRGLMIAGAVSIVLVALAATTPGILVMGWALEHIPGAGLLRDAQKWIALAVPAYVILAASGAEYLARRARGATADVGQWLAAGVSALIIIAAVPTLPADVAPLRPIPSWEGWSAVSGVVALDDDSVAVLPAGSYRIINGRPVLDPATKILPAPVVSSGELIVSGQSVSGEGATTVERTLLGGATSPAEVDLALQSLRDQGIGWVLVENSPGNFGDSADIVAALDPVYTTADLQLYHVPGVIKPTTRPSQGAYAAAWLTFGIWALCLLAGLLAALLEALLPRRR